MLKPKKPREEAQQVNTRSTSAHTRQISSLFPYGFAAAVVGSGASGFSVWRKEKAEEIKRNCAGILDCGLEVLVLRGVNQG